MYRRQKSWQKGKQSQSTARLKNETEVWKHHRKKHISVFFFIYFSGDPLVDLIPIYLDVFRGDSYLLKKFLESYKLPFASNISRYESTEGDQKFGRLSYVAM